MVCVCVCAYPRATRSFFSWAMRVNGSIEGSPASSLALCSTTHCLDSSLAPVVCIVCACVVCECGVVWRRQREIRRRRKRRRTMQDGFAGLRSKTTLSLSLSLSFHHSQSPLHHINNNNKKINLKKIKNARL